MHATQKSKISSFGGIAALFGVASIILSFFDFNLVLLMWVDFWGETIAWVIRVGLIVIGLAVYFMMKENDKALFSQENDQE